MPKNISWIDADVLERESYRDALYQAFPGTKIEIENWAGEAYRTLEQRMRDIVVINPYLSPGENCPYEPPAGWDKDPVVVGFDLATRIRAMNAKVPIIILGGREVRSFVNEGTENPCPAATEIIYALDVLPRQFTEIMRKYM